MAAVFVFLWLCVGICLIIGAWHIALALIGIQIVLYVLRGLFTDYWP
jgi:hypothetical protein